MTENEKYERKEWLQSVDRPCDECGVPVPILEQWQQVVEGGAAIAKGHRACIEGQWGPA